MDIISLYRRFGDQDECIAYLERTRWGDTTLCAYCSSKRVSKIKGSYRYHCNGCKCSFSVLVGTVFEGTKLPLIKWFTAICLISNAKKGISSRQLARYIKVNKDTAWYMQMRIRAAMKDSDMYFGGIVEADESYVGGAMKNKKKEERTTKYKDVITGMAHRIPLLGVYQRGGKIVVKVLEKASGEYIRPVLKKLLDAKAELVTDGFGGYYGLGRQYKRHVILNHSKGEHRKGDYHTNTVEGYWSMLKRSIIGQYHKVSKEYIQAYVDELSFKYNYRNQNLFNIMIERSLNRKLSIHGT